MAMKEKNTDIATDTENGKIGAYLDVLLETLLLLM